MSAKANVVAKPKKTAEEKPSTRDHLIDVGLDLMRRHGYGATGLQEILKAADVPKGSFYHHFGSKEEFTAAVIQRYAGIAGEHCRSVLENKKLVPLKRLRRYFEELITMAGQSAAIQGCLLGKIGLEVAGVNVMLQGHVSTSFAGWQEGITATLREAAERGELTKSFKPKSLAGYVLNSWEGALLRSQADKSDAPLQEFVHYTFDVLLTK